ncbi:MAG: sugar phosphate nucleotidyltransferase [Candidatus Poribacteria bacterium]|nr:sugar phosphate nucleotidyltransferase [Candidatus Poribacteria bacterium]
MQAIILCGGSATRLGAAAKHTPKLLMKVKGRSILQWQCEFLKDVGVQELILATGHLHDVLQNSIGESYNGISIRYCRENKKLDTGGAIKNAMQYIQSSPFFVLNGDILWRDFSLNQMVSTFRADMAGLLLSVWVDDSRPYGEILSSDTGRITAFLEKPTTYQSGYINAGVYLFNSKIAQVFPNKDVFSLSYDVLPKLKSLYVLKADTDWIDIGSPERLQAAQQLF